jgi:hypothetical protein
MLHFKTVIYMYEIVTEYIIVVLLLICVLEVLIIYKSA